MFLGKNFKQHLKCLALVFSMALLPSYAIAQQVNINQADAETLQYIPGIGPVKSEQIIKLREQLGGFDNYQQLLAIQGIGEKVLDQIQQHSALDSGVAKLTPEMVEKASE